MVTTRAMAWWMSPEWRYHVPCVRTARCIPTVCSYPRTVGHTVGCPGEVLQRAYQGYPPQEHPPCSVALRMHLRMHRSTTTQYHRMYHTPWHPPCGRSTWYHVYYHHSVPSGWCVVTTRAMAWWSSPGRYHVPCVRTARCIPTVCKLPTYLPPVVPRGVPPSRPYRRSWDTLPDHPSQGGGGLWETQDPSEDLRSVSQTSQRISGVRILTQRCLRCSTS